MRMSSFLETTYFYTFAGLMKLRHYSVKQHMSLCHKQPRPCLETVVCHKLELLTIFQVDFPTCKFLLRNLSNVLVQDCLNPNQKLNLKTVGSVLEEACSDLRALTLK